MPRVSDEELRDVVSNDQMRGWRNVDIAADLLELRQLVRDEVVPAVEYAMEHGVFALPKGTLSRLRDIEKEVG